MNKNSGKRIKMSLYTVGTLFRKGSFLRRNHEYFTDSNKCKIHTFKPRSLLTARLCRGVQGCCGACGIHDKQSKGLHS